MTQLGNVGQAPCFSTTVLVLWAHDLRNHDFRDGRVTWCCMKDPTAGLLSKADLTNIAVECLKPQQQRLALSLCVVKGSLATCCKLIL